MRGVPFSAPHPKARPACLRVVHLETEAVLREDLAHDGEAEAAAIALGAEKRSEEAPARLVGEAGTGVGDLEGDVPALRSDRERFSAFHGAMLRRGIYLPPSQFEAWFLSIAHGDEEVRQTVAAAREAMLQLV